MLWKIYVVIFTILNLFALLFFEYGAGFNQLLGVTTIVLDIGLNIAVFSYAFKKPFFSKQILVWLFRINIGLIALFILFESLAFLQEIFGSGIKLPTSGFVSIIANFPALPALYATYKLAYAKIPKFQKKKR